MFYRVVLQGRAAGDHDLSTVKLEFARVTGLPENVTEQLFAQVPRRLREGVSQADAERIAATLRAIGAAVTVERDLLAASIAVDGGVQEIVPPEHRGPPTLVPGAAAAPAPGPPTAAQRLRRRLRRYLPYVLGAPLAVIVLVELAPYVDEGLRALHPVPAAPPAPARPPPVATPDAPPARASASVLHGPWRCTDQRTGLSTYWTFGAGGAVAFHGDTLKDGAAGRDDPTAPIGWQLTDNLLVFTYALAPPVAYEVSDLDLMRLRYGDGGELDTQCRRP